MIELLKNALNEESIVSYIFIVLKIILIVIVANVFSGIFKRALHTRLSHLESRQSDESGKDKGVTVIPILQNLLKVGIWTIAGILILGEMGINTSALIAGLGMFGIAIGLAAQSIIKDFIAGILLIIENLISVGDSINVGGINGTVERVGIRYIQVRLFSGELRNIPSSELSNFGNKSKGYMRVSVNVGLAYEQDIEKALRVMEEAASLWSRENLDIIIEHPAVQAITEFGASEVTARIIATVKSGEQSGAERELRMILKQRFDARNVDIPFARNVLYMHSKDSQDLEINTDDLDILPEPGSKEELKDSSLQGMVFERETKKMAGAINNLNNLLDKNKLSSDSDKSAENEQNKPGKNDKEENHKNE